MPVPAGGKVAADAAAKREKQEAEANKEATAKDC